MNPRSVCIVVCCVLGVLVPGAASGQAAAPADSSYRLKGVVTDAAREPVPDAEVVVIGRDATAVPTTTDGRGRFDLGSFGAGPLSFRVRRLGYEERTMNVQMGASRGPLSVEVVLTSVAGELADVYIRSNSNDRLQGFYQRRQQRGTFGRFLEAEDIRKLGPMNASELFRTVPGIHISSNPTGGNALRIRNCQPMVWVDAQRVPGAELDEVITPGDIAAIEFYPSSAGIPAQYLERGNRLCGLILVWTKDK
jgi:hypothetical protein